MRIKIGSNNKISKSNISIGDNNTPKPNNSVIKKVLIPIVITVISGTIVGIILEIIN